MGDIKTWSPEMIAIAVLSWSAFAGIAAVVGFGILALVDLWRGE